MWGHAADGNIHINVTGVGFASDRGDGGYHHRLDDAVLSMVAGLGGSISAEHTRIFGTGKRAWTRPASRSPAEIDAFRAVKRALDPDWIWNPNVLLPPVASASEVLLVRLLASQVGADRLLVGRSGRARHHLRRRSAPAAQRRQRLPASVLAQALGILLLDDVLERVPQRRRLREPPDRQR